MAIDGRSSLAMHDHIANDHVMNGAGRFAELDRHLIPLAMPLEFEVECVAVSSPKPIKAVQVHGEIRHDDVADRTTGCNLKSDAAVGVKNRAVVDENVAN